MIPMDDGHGYGERGGSVNAPAPHSAREGTFTLPLTPAMRRFLRDRAERTRAMTLGGLAVALLVLPALSLAGYGEIGVLAALALLGYGCYNELVVRRDARDDLAMGTFTRYIGRLTVDEIPIYDDTDASDESADRRLTGYRYELKVPAYAFAVSEVVGRTLRAAPWGEVDYLDVSGVGAPAGVLLEVHDREGRRLHRHPQYEPAAPS
jgi:hypothetical protein